MPSKSFIVEDKFELEDKRLFVFPANDLIESNTPSNIKSF